MKPNSVTQNFPNKKISVSRLLCGTLLASYILFLAAPVAFAAIDFTATPVVIDGKGKQREILRYTLSLANTTKHLVSVYPWVIDVDGALGETGTSDLGGSQNKDISTSLARWTEVTRGSIDMLPGDHKDIPLMIQINLNAKPGMYHAMVHLSEGGDRASAEANKTNTIDVAVNIEVLEDINERVELATFVPDQNVFAGDQASFAFKLSNIGNRGVVPHGKIRIYDRRGEEVASIDANQDSKKIEPLAKQMLSSVWVSNGSFGRYKAMLDLEYGARGTIQDTVFFWVIPWKKVLGMFLSLTVLCIIVALVFYSRVEARRGGVFAPARVSRGRFYGIFSGFGFDSDSDENEHDDEERYAPPLRKSEQTQRNVVSELREVPPLRPVHTRLYREIEPEQPSTRLSDRVKEVPYGHQVHLTKRESEKPNPEHVVNLRR